MALDRKPFIWQIPTPASEEPHFAKHDVISLRVSPVSLCTLGDS